MLNFKGKIANTIEKIVNIDTKELEGYIEIPKDSQNGDYAFPCFRLAKSLKKSPMQIATEIKEKMEIDNNIIEKVEVIGGYLNFYLNKALLTKEVLTQLDQVEEYGKANIGEGKTVVIDYSSPNIAKPFHIRTFTFNCNWRSFIQYLQTFRLSHNRNKPPRRLWYSIWKIN